MGVMWLWYEKRPLVHAVFYILCRLSAVQYHLYLGIFSYIRGVVANLFLVTFSSWFYSILLISFFFIGWLFFEAFRLSNLSMVLTKQ